jgi:dCTP deaminase
MLLSDRDIRTYVMTGSLGVEPFDPEMIQPSSLDVRLDRTFRVMKDEHTFIDPAEKQDLYERVVVPDGDPFVLRSGEFALASTYEKVLMPEDLAGRLEGKSSLGRLGLLVHTTAGFIDPGFEGQITLELVNLAPRPIKLWPGMKIGQLCLMLMTSAARYPYGHEHNGSRYQGQRGPTPSRSHRDFHITRL